MRAQLNHRPHCGPILTPRWEGEVTLLAKSYFINLYFRNCSIDLKFILWVLYGDKPFKNLDTVYMAHF